MKFIIKNIVFKLILLSSLSVFCGDIYEVNEEFSEFKHDLVEEFLARKGGDALDVYRNKLREMQNDLIELTLQINILLKDISKVRETIQSDYMAYVPHYSDQVPSTLFGYARKMIYLSKLIKEAENIKNDAVVSTFDEHKFRYDYAVDKISNNISNLIGKYSFLTDVILDEKGFNEIEQTNEECRSLINTKNVDQFIDETCARFTCFYSKLHKKIENIYNYDRKAMQELDGEILGLGFLDFDWVKIFKLRKTIQQIISSEKEEVEKDDAGVNLKYFCGWYASIAALAQLAGGEIDDIHHDFDPQKYPIFFGEPWQLNGIKAPCCSEISLKTFGFVKRFGVLGLDLADYIGGTFVRENDYSKAFSKIRQELEQGKPVIVFLAESHWVMLSALRGNSLLVFDNGSIRFDTIDNLEKKMDIRGKSSALLKNLSLVKWIGTALISLADLVGSTSHPDEAALAINELWSVDTKTQQFGNFNFIILSRSYP